MLAKNDSIETLYVYGHLNENEINSYLKEGYRIGSPLYIERERRLVTKEQRNSIITLLSKWENKQELECMSDRDLLKIYQSYLEV